MSSYLDKSYRFQIDPTKDYSDDFLQFLKAYFKEIINYRLSFYNQLGVPILDRVYTFILEDLPTEEFDDQTISKIIDTAQLVSSFKQEVEEIDEDGILAQATTFKEELEQLNPLEVPQLKLEITLKEIIEKTTNKLSFFTETILEATHWFFGLKPNLWFTGHPILLEEVLKTVDYGNLEYEPMNLFSFVFRTFEANFELLYNYFNNLGEETKVDVDNNEL